MKKFLAPFAIAALMSGTCTAADYDVGLGIEHKVRLPIELHDTFVFQKPLTYLQRLDYKVLHGEIRAVVMKITAYDLSQESCEKSRNDPTFGITSTGKKVRAGMVAVDPNVIPYGTHLYISGYGEVVAEDTGGAIKGNSLDIYMDNKSDCLAWGTQRRKVYILGRK